MAVEGLVGGAMVAGHYFLLQCARRLGGRANGYAGVAKLTCPDAAIVFELVIAAKCFGLGISYFIVVGDLLPQIALYFTANTLLCSRLLWLLAFSVFVFPLALVKELDHLYYTSFVALFAIALLVWIILWGFLSGGPIDWESIAWVRMDAGFYSGFPLFVYAFSCHENIFTIYNELLDNGPFNLSVVVVGATAASGLVYGVAGVLGYLTHGHSVSPNILAMYEIGPVLTLGRIAVVVLAAFSYPFQSYPCRAVLLKLLDDRGPYVSLSGGSAREESPARPRAYFYTTAFIVGGNCCVAIAVHRLDRVLSLVGSVGSTSIALIFPALMFLQLDRIGGVSPSGRYLQRGAAYFLATFGVVALVLCSAYNIYDIFF